LLLSHRRQPEARLVLREARRLHLRHAQATARRPGADLARAVAVETGGAVEILPASRALVAVAGEFHVRPAQAGVNSYKKHVAPFIKQVSKFRRQNRHFSSSTSYLIYIFSVSLFFHLLGQEIQKTFAVFAFTQNSRADLLRPMR
jgi:hypothetical protein